MTHLQKIKSFIPFLVLLLLIILLWRELSRPKQNAFSSAMIGEPIPVFSLSNLLNPEKQFTQQDLIGKVSLLNVWASWCYACKIEMPMLMKIKQDNHIPIYGLNYKDEAPAVFRFLQQYGNPYLMTGDDRNGTVAIDLGIYGTPETFVISKEGKIVYRHTGVINQAVWDEVLFPLIQKYNSAS